MKNVECQKKLWFFFLGAFGKTILESPENSQEVGYLVKLQTLTHACHPVRRFAAPPSFPMTLQGKSKIAVDFEKFLVRSVQCTEALSILFVIMLKNVPHSTKSFLDG